jgi:hypothetical protein
MKPLRSFVSPQVGVLGIAVKLSAFEESNQERDIFSALPECPAALSLGQQVNEQGKGWVWFPNQLPFFIKPERLAEVVFHCPASAKVYADR